MTKGILPKPLHITLLLITLTLVSAAANHILGSKPNPPALFTIGLEAEQGLLIPPMVINSTASASGDAYLSSNTRDAGIVTFSVDLANDGNYMIWGRVLAPDLYRDSFFVSIDGGPEDVYDVANDIWSDSWQWTRVNGRADAGTPLTVNPRIFELSAGSHEIVFRAREPDTKLDRLIITNDLSFVPDDAGPAPGPTPPPPPTGGRQFYAAAQGRPDGDGSQNNPWSLPAVMGHPTAVRPGDTIYLRGGTYNLRGQLATHFSQLTGSAAAPITVRAYPGERPVIDWDYLWMIDGAYTNYVGLELMSSGALKVMTHMWADGRPSALRIRGAHVKVINCVIHDIGETGISTEATDAELYGNIMYYVGFITPDRGVGTTAYTQSETGPVQIRDNIMFQQFGHNLQLYGSDTALIKNVTIDGNTLFNAGVLGPTPGFNAVVWPGARPAERIMFRNNYVYASRDDGTSVHIPGANGVVNRDLTVSGNYFIGGGPVMRIGAWDPVTFNDNTIVSAQPDLLWDAGLSAVTNRSRFDWDRNSYHYQGAGRPFLLGGLQYDLAGWRSATGFDQSSAMSTGRRAGVKVFVRPNAHEAGRAHITVINWEAQDNVLVELAGAGLRAGQRYEVRDVQNYFGAPVAAGTYNGGPVRLPLNLTAVTPLVGAGHPANAAVRLPVHTPKEFNVFVLLPL